MVQARLMCTCMLVLLVLCRACKHMLLLLLPLQHPLGAWHSTAAFCAHLNLDFAHVLQLLCICFTLRCIASIELSGCGQGYSVVRYCFSGELRESCNLLGKAVQCHRPYGLILRAALVQSCVLLHSSNRHFHTRAVLLQWVAEGERGSAPQPEAVG